jgi:hypothetical protein
MRAILRGMTAWGALVLAPSIAAAQNVAEPPAQAPAPDAIGPRELQNFSLPGTTTQPADRPVVPAAPATTEPPPKASDATRAASEPKPRAEAPKPSAETRVVAPAATAPRPAIPTTQQQAPLPQPAFSAPPPAPSPAVAPATVAEPEHRPAILPWLLAALALGGATAFFLWRRRPREAFAAAPEPELLRVPEPAPAPRPPAPRATPQPPAAAPPAPKTAPAHSGIVATGLRPSLEIGIEPLRCVIADDQVEIEFAIDLYNAGTAPARAVLAEASMLNAGATQEQELAGFFANPVGAGQRLDAIQPMSRVQLTSKVVAPRAAVQEYELAGRKAFVPVIAFNALYEWSGRKGQTSAAYLIGRETRGDKLGPLRLDNGPHEVRGLAALALPTAVRT